MSIFKPSTPVYGPSTNGKEALGRKNGRRDERIRI
jgi:hypothetical protein